MKKKKNEELTPWAKYQKEHKNDNKPINRRARQFTKNSSFQNFKRWFNFKGESDTGRPDAFIKRYFDWNLTKQLKIVIASVAVIVVLMILYFVTPISRVQSVQIAGNKRVNSEAIIKELAIHRNDLTLVTALTEGSNENQLLKKFTDIKDADVKVSFFGKVKVKIQENAVMGYVVRNKVYYTVKADGAVIKKSTTQPNGNYPIFRGFKKDKILTKFLKEYKTLPNEVQNDVAEVNFSPTKKVKNRLHFLMNDGNQVYALISTFAKKMKYYPGISASMKKRGIIDLQVGAYSRPYGWKDEYKETKEATENAESSAEYVSKQKEATKESLENESSEPNLTSSSSEIEQ